MPQRMLLKASCNAAKNVMKETREKFPHLRLLFH